MLIHLVAPGQPVSGKNSKDAFVVAGAKGPRAVVRKSKAVSSWYDRVVPILARQFAAFGLPTLKGRLHVEVNAYAIRPWDHKQTPDGDNVQSAAWDALKRAYVIADDRQIVSWGGLREQDAANPRVEIEVRVL